MILVMLLDLRTIDLPCNYRGRRCLCRARTRSRWRELRTGLGGYASAVSRRIFSGIARPDGASGHGQRQGCARAHTGVWSASAALAVVSAACGMYGSMCHEYGAFAMRGANYSRVEVDRIFTRVAPVAARRQELATWHRVKRRRTRLGAPRFYSDASRESPVRHRSVRGRLPAGAVVPSACATDVPLRCLALDDGARAHVHHDQTRRRAARPRRRHRRPVREARVPGDTPSPPHAAHPCTPADRIHCAQLKALKLYRASESLLRTHYSDLVERPFFPKLLEYMLSGPVTCMVVREHA